MNTDIKNFFLAGLGSAAYTYEKATTLIDDLMQKGKLTFEEGKDLSEELKRTVKEKKEVDNSLANDNKPLTKEDIAALLQEMNLATKEDIENLNKRLTALEISNS
ncbi:MAG: phasin family protein [Clostridium sp.]|uniref:phasin family protein n=1 Tax=Clostridium sp. TaxID=1506 RepID=UPI003D6D7821